MLCLHKDSCSTARHIPSQCAYEHFHLTPLYLFCLTRWSEELLVGRNFKYLHNINKPNEKCHNSSNHNQLFPATGDKTLSINRVNPDANKASVNSSYTSFSKVNLRETEFAMNVHELMIITSFLIQGKNFKLM
jgi:hypothetical protein